MPLSLRWDQAKDLSVRLIRRDIRQTTGSHDHVPDAAESFEQHFNDRVAIISRTASVLSNQRIIAAAAIGTIGPLSVVPKQIFQSFTRRDSLIMPRYWLVPAQSSAYHRNQ